MNVSAQTLRLYSGLLASPGSDSLEVLRDLAVEYGWLRQPLNELENLPLGEWQAEHTRLFISGHPRTVCPPFESAFLGGTMFGPACERLGDLYLHAGLQADGAPPDYLGTIMECIAYLQEQPCDHSKALLQKLWHEHLISWLPGFSAALQAESRLLLYRMLGSQLARLCSE